MKKLSLIFAPPSADYQDIVWSVKDSPSPPQTALSELGAYVQAYSSSPIKITNINPQTQEAEKFRYRTAEEIVDLCTDHNIVGLTCLYHNQETTHKIAELIKQRDSSKTIVLGGPNVSNRFMAQGVLNQISAVDYVALGEGEDTLLGLIEEKPLNQIPNLAYRKNDKIEFTKRKTVNLDKIPIWNYDDVLEAEKLLMAQDSNTQLYWELAKRYGGRTPGEIGVFSQRGCPKASGEIGNRPGTCRYCTSVENSRSVMIPTNFWRQVEVLNQQYGIQDFFITDNVFSLNLNQLKEFKKAHQSFNLSSEIQFRAYSYPSLINGKEGPKIATTLREIGVTNIFLGVETFSPEISLLSNKDPTTYSNVEKAIRLLRTASIDSFISFLPGLPGESKESLQTNLDGLEKLISKHSSKEYGQGNLTRVDISPAMPLVGTSWHAQLIRNNQIQTEYFDQTRKNLKTDLTPDFDVLRNLSLKYYSSVTAKNIQQFKTNARKICLKKMKPEMMGAFDLRINNFK